MAARKISRLAIGSPIRSPGGDTVTLVPDLTQEDHFSKSFLSARAAEVSSTITSRSTRKYDIQIRLARDRNEHVEGLREPGEVELLLDDERVGLFTVKPPPAGQDHSQVDTGLKARIPRKGRSSRCGRHVPEKELAAPRNGTAAVTSRVQHR